MAFNRHAADFDRFRGLEVRAQHDAGGTQPFAHALEVAAQDCPVENEGGGRQVIEGLGGHDGEISMPIENERKFVLKDDGDLERRLAERPGVTKSFLRQAYLDVSGMRIRSVEEGGAIRHVFTYKRPIDGQVVEIETEISAIDFERLWSQRRETL